MPDPFTYHILDPENAHLLHHADVFDYPVDRVQLAVFVDNPAYEMAFATCAGKCVGPGSFSKLFE